VKRVVATLTALAAPLVLVPAAPTADITQAPAQVSTALFVERTPLAKTSRSKIRKTPVVKRVVVKPPKPARKGVQPVSAPQITQVGARGLGQHLAALRGWTGQQWTCLNELWTRESNWRISARNPSGAYGIPQALPGSKMGPGWQTSATVQITWGLGYIAARYGTPCGAWAHSNSTGWY
jgi:hypothetical protein